MSTNVAVLPPQPITTVDNYSGTVNYSGAVQVVPVAAAPVKKRSFLQHLGSVLKTMLHIGEAAAVAATPIIKIAFPEVYPLYESTLGLATGAEALAPTLTGTGPQKLQQLVSSLLPSAQKWAKDNNIDWPEAEIEKWASAVVDTINLIPAPKQ